MTECRKHRLQPNPGELEPNGPFPWTYLRSLNLAAAIDPATDQHATGQKNPFMKSIPIKYAVRIYSHVGVFEVLMESGWTIEELHEFCKLQFKIMMVYKVHGYIVGPNEKRIIELV